ncbi:paraquat-inducible protein A [Thalassotalea sp. G2M2-11]|uniref:paraquat-inducible protein A n=1 Tax=Thalassotalea sp. G2M2-11 TaxID=2787627 RepID=UPI0019D1A97F|nr:paraquat-inducible protein A [Thalassotalea sp. G2M2-11]
MPPISPGESAICPCCGATLFSRKKQSIERTLAISTAGLLIYIPAITLPLLSIRALGVYNEVSLLQSILLLIEDEFYLVAFCVFIFTLAVPLVRLFSTFYLSLQLKRQQITPSLLTFFRSYHQLDHWGMTQVFFLGVIISIYKLLTMATLTIGSGLISLFLLLLCSTLITSTLDHHYVWEKMEQALAISRE